MREEIGSSPLSREPQERSERSSERSNGESAGTVNLGSVETERSQDSEHLFAIQEAITDEVWWAGCPGRKRDGKEEGPRRSFLLGPWNCELRTANCELRTANCELRTANCDYRPMKDQRQAS
jgi:hypothetical protein